jgi:hypothetical protein
MPAISLLFALSLSQEKWAVCMMPCTVIVGCDSSPWARQQLNTFSTCAVFSGESR